ncbi:STAS domain-containing protein [Actinokineospora sp. 24-640]
MDVESVDTHVTVRVRGEVDMGTTEELCAALIDADARCGDRALVVDLSGVSFIGSAGLAALLDARTRRPDLTLLIGSDLVRRVFALAGLTGFFHVESTEIAVEDAHSKQR